MNISLLVVAALLVAGIFVALYVVAVSRHQKASTGKLELIGALASVETALEPEGAILVRGEMWLARSQTGDCIERGRKVRVVGSRSHLLEVELVG